MPRKVVISGKGGIGKSTLTTILAQLAVRAGQRVLQVGCDPKHDSCAHQGGPVEPVMSYLATRGRLSSADLERLIVRGRAGVDCLEIGGPEPGVGCAGRAINLVLDLMRETSGFLDRWDLIIYDLLGDVVCGGFAAPMRTGKDSAIYIVLSGEVAPIYAGNNIARGIVNLARRGGGRLAGLLLNRRGTPGEDELADTFAQAIGTRVVGRIPRDDAVVLAELRDTTVVEAFPDSPAGLACAQAVEALLATGPDDLVIPTPLEDAQLQALLESHLRKVVEG